MSANFNAIDVRNHLQKKGIPAKDLMVDRFLPKNCIVVVGKIEGKPKTLILCPRIPVPEGENFSIGDLFYTEVSRNNDEPIEITDAKVHPDDEDVLEIRLSKREKFFFSTKLHSVVEEPAPLPLSIEDIDGLDDDDENCDYDYERAMYDQ